jgi:hypothetical protein
VVGCARDVSDAVLKVGSNEDLRCWGGRVATHQECTGTAIT